MDAYSMTYTSPALRSSSRIYQDLITSAYLHNIVGVGPQYLDRSLKTMEFSTKRMRGTGRDPHIGIIGAGLAGLRCADMLLQHGFKVTIVEGRDRIGGRLYQETLPNGRVVDIGPNWIHGTNNNPILDIAKNNGIAMHSWDTGSLVFDENGGLHPTEDGEKHSGMMWGIVQDAFKHSNKHSAEIDPRESLFDFFKTRIVEVIPETTEDWQRKREVVLQMADLWGAFIGSPIERQSLKFFWLEECIEGENLFCAGTYEKILKEIAAPALKGAKMQYETVVETIHSRSGLDDDDAVIFTTTTGQQLEFDEVVVTSPLGWLQKNPKAFDPPLPPHLTKAINSISYGCLEKVYISFPKAFWLSTDDQGRAVRGFCQWLSPKFALDTNPKRWTIEVVELASLTPETAHPTLLFYIYGDQSHHIVDEVSKLSTKAAQDKFLYDFFSPYYTRMPHYDVRNPDCQPVCAYATHWLKDDLAGNGSYSNFQVGLQEGDKDIQTMREGLPDQGLWLAGEHTAPFVALGTATGAYWSGESVGRRIAEVYGRS